MENHAQKIRLLEDTIDRVIMGKRPAIRLAVTTLLARGHLLIEDVPGVGKTTLAYTLSRALDCTFQRIQFTSDLLPSDIIGVSIYNSDKGVFEFKEGPLFSNILLADEINRTNPKTQSALLEAMNERRVSVDRRTYKLPEPFMVIATENPMEYHGTFPLPESQLDRFMTTLRIGYPSAEYEKKAVLSGWSFEDIDRIKPVITARELISMQNASASVRVDGSLVGYLMDIIARTRIEEQIRLGASTRAAQYLLSASKASAFYGGRDFVSPSDIKEIAPYVLGHRLIMRKKASIAEATDIVREIVESIAVPL